MKKSELYNIILDEVCEVCEVRRTTVVSSSKMQAVVDARILAVQYLRRAGMSFEEIALYVMREASGDAAYCPAVKDLRSKAKGIRKLFGSYTFRCYDSMMFQMLSRTIQADLKSIYELSTNPSQRYT